MPELTVIGGINVDFVVKVPQFPAPGESAVGSEFFQTFGGKGANQAVAASRLGQFPVRMIGAVGNDEIGKQAIANLQDQSVDVELVERIDNATTGVALIFVNAAAENCISVVVGANGRLGDQIIDQISNSHFEPGNFFLASLESPIAVVKKIFEKAKSNGATTLLNPAPANKKLMDSELLELCDFLTPNETELAILSGVPLQSSEITAESKATILKAGEVLRERGAKDVIVTLGDQGCFHCGEIGAVSCPSIDAVDTTAAGDTFNGALTVALMEGKPLSSALAFANNAAALSAMTAGAQPSLPTRSQIEAFLSSKR